ncbi:GNAT family N-acetyltransferase [Vibrio neptunius]|uniref:GNAT family N-acetyltransferase n=1 Tax=Vibrio neptunius TaxID=170651 RepID=A0ABS3A489_9VIBR|nr:GNAT family N-acetyltransferase [Vibrio neptunius]MBN3494033.1 GNAT family N-acetyltransferase [Vibrio neptunius]MBN3516530.1 GNAT family N-acetyltransferase [Vibrio neptunius]MBN3550704.1 GNAT family N-acetyltransferase [Vibrio neptunius]MBN3578835.1 GNAT family N-acetyltransferase [Vibrio neptunius]MCH9872500.1 GNAT family N-acetyltransferase [Vibrio neptunius]
MDVRKISAEDTLALRHLVLWPEKSVDFCRLEEDDASLHFGAFVAGKLVCVASVFVTDDVARLRKFATSPEYQGQGIGSNLLKVIISQLQNTGVIVFWCDARESALSVYKRIGMAELGECFYKGDIPYYKMSVTWD